VTALRGGQSLAQVAQAHGVQPTAVGSAVIAAGDAKIAALEDAHKITPTRADRLRVRLNRATAKLLTRHFR
jgi:transposase-like protein